MHKTGAVGDDASIAIRVASGEADVARARALFEEYARWLGVDLCFQGFAEELATLPGAYAPPVGRLLLAGSERDAFGCVALRPLANERREQGAPAACEMKRLYVQPRARRGQWGRRLALRVIDDARRMGYREIKLDTLQRMLPARALYESLGFVECEPYYHNPIGGTVYMRLDLAGSGPTPPRGAGDTDKDPR